MERRLAMLALLACVLAAQRHDSDSEPDDSFSLWDDYEDSYETTLPPKLRTTTPSVKVILRGKVPKVSLKTSGDDKVLKTTNINIESHTNFIVTKSPVAKPAPGTGRPVVQIGDEYVWVELPVEHATRLSTTNRPTARRTSSTRRPSSTHRPSSTRRTTAKPIKRTLKTTKAPPTKAACQPKTNWLSSYFQKNKVKNKIGTQPAESGWFLGLFSTLYKWIVSSRTSWFSGGWFEDGAKPKKPSATITTSSPIPPTEKPTTWFQSLLNNEDNDGSDSANEDTINKKPTKKSLKKNYKGYQLLRTYPDVEWKVREMVELQEEAQGSGVMWWSSPSINGSTDLLVPPDLLVDIKDHLKTYKIDFDVVIWDLQKAITYENPRLSKKQRLELEQLRGHPMTWRRYHRYADILRYLEYLQLSNPDLVDLVSLGRSSEGLPLVAVKISLPANASVSKESSDDKKKWRLRSRMKPVVWLDGGAHAREWIAPAVATWIIHALVEGDKETGAEVEILRQADFYIMPVLNPDGYEHSHTHDRLWKKTRSRQPDYSDNYYVGWFPWNWGQTECVGVDADRNWDYHWGEKDSSTDPCSDNYSGSHPFSEPETRAVSDFLTEHRGQIKVFVSLHAYSQSWLIPSTHAGAQFSDDGVLMEMGKLAVAALGDMYGTKYQVGTAAELRQPASGMAHDWAKARAGIKFSYHVDLRDAMGPYGFLLPGSQIVSTARETWQAVRTIVDNLTPG